MLSSLVLLALSSVALADQARLGSNPSPIPDVNLPLLDHPVISRPATGLIGFEIKGSEEIEDEDLTQNATIKLYPNYTHCSKPLKFFSGCEEPERAIVSLAPGVCLSGDFNLYNNFKVTEDPICPDGTKPTMVFYDQVGCRGQAQYSSEHHKAVTNTHECLWSHEVKQWSMVFRCEIWPTTIQGADEHQIAPAPIPASNEISIEELAVEDQSKPGVVITHRSIECDKKRTTRQVTIPVDKCFSLQMTFGLQLKEVGICPNGTRAKWARFSDKKCGNGVISPKFGLVDIQDLSLDQCIRLGILNSGGEIFSMAFWCDGISETTSKEEEKHTLKTVTILGTDPAVRKAYQDAEAKLPKSEVKRAEGAKPGVIYTHLSPECNGHNPRKTVLQVDKCLTTPKLGLQIKELPICSNGTRALWARFEDKKCNYGVPSTELGLLEIKDSDVGKCLDTRAVGSMSFWCDGFGDVKKPDPNAPEEPKMPKPKKGSVSESACVVGKAPFYSHPKTDVCVDLKTQKMQIYSTGVCTNGTTALLAKFGKKGCAGGVMGLGEVKEEEFKKCLDFEGVESFAFWCSGKGVEKEGKGGKIAIVVLSVLIVLGVLGGGLWAAFNTELVDKIKEIYRSRGGYIALPAKL